MSPEQDRVTRCACVLAQEAVEVTWRWFHVYRRAWLDCLHPAPLNTGDLVSLAVQILKGSGAHVCGLHILELG